MSENELKPYNHTLHDLSANESFRLSFIIFFFVSNLPLIIYYRAFQWSFMSFFIHGQHCLFYILINGIDRMIHENQYYQNLS